MSANTPNSLLPQRAGLPRGFCLPSNGERIIFEGRTYEIGDRIDTGGFAEVFECTDDFGEKLVAKVICPCDRSFDDVRTAWEREFICLNALRHPSITHVHAAFEYRDTFYLIIEHCNFTLAKLLNFGWFEPDVWLLPLAKAVLNALDFIHCQNIVHRDLHLGNVYAQMKQSAICPVQAAVVFKIGDFGVSKLNIPSLGTGSLFADWIRPPETINPHEFGAIGNGCDIYHAAILLLSVSLRRELRFTTEETLAGKPRLMAEALASPFAPAIAKALRRHTNSRTANAMEFWRDLRFCQTQFATSLQPAPRGN